VVAIPHPGHGVGAGGRTPLAVRVPEFLTAGGGKQALALEVTLQFEVDAAQLRQDVVLG
jgi:hypothetical protein